MNRKQKKTVIDLLDYVYSSLIKYKCNDEIILGIIDDIQNKIEDYQEQDHCDECGDDQNKLVSWQNIKLCECCHETKLEEYEELEEVQ